MKTQPPRRYCGVHLSIAGGLSRVFHDAAALGINCAQIFTKTPNRWQAPDFREDDVLLFTDAWKAMDSFRLFAHTGYLINLAGEGDNRDKSVLAMIDEMQRAERLGITGLVLHPGSHRGIGEAEAVVRIAGAIDEAIGRAENVNVRILLETSSGQGSSVGSRFEHLRDIIGASAHPGRLAVCLDTCHIFAAGYDLVPPDKCRATIDDFDRVIGLGRLSLIHLNDSKRECGSRVDRHEHIGRGEIGSRGMKNILADSRLFPVPLVLETPKFNDLEADMMNLKKVRSLMRAAASASARRSR